MKTHILILNSENGINESDYPFLEKIFRQNTVNILKKDKIDEVFHHLDELLDQKKQFPKYILIDTQAERQDRLRFLEIFKAKYKEKEINTEVVLLAHDDPEVPRNKKLFAYENVEYNGSASLFTFQNTSCSAS